MILKLLIAGVVLFVLYVLFFKKTKEKNIDDNFSDKTEDIMVECPKCKTYVSKNEGILSNGAYFCSKECLKGK